MSNPYDQDPQSQPSANPYEQPAPQYPPAGQQYPPAGQQYPPAGQQYPPAGQQYSPVPYGQQPYGAVGMEHPQGTTVFVLGIIGIFTGICAPIAWYLGNKTLAEIAASGTTYSNESQIKTGRMLGKVFTIIYAAVFALWILGFIAFFAIVAAQAS